MHLRQIAGLLEERGVIRSKQSFILITTLLGKKARIKAGEYEFTNSELPLEVLNSLVKGQVKRHLVTIPEGYTLSQIAQLLEDLNIVGKKEFFQKTSSPAFISSLGLFHPVQGRNRADTGGLPFPRNISPDPRHGP